MNDEFARYEEELDMRIRYALGGIALGVGIQALVSLMVVSGTQDKAQTVDAISYQLLAFIIPVCTAKIAMDEAPDNSWPWLNHYLAVLFNTAFAGVVGCFNLAMLVYSIISLMSSVKW